MNFSFSLKSLAIGVLVVSIVLAVWSTFVTHQKLIKLQRVFGLPEKNACEVISIGYISNEKEETALEGGYLIRVPDPELYGLEVTYYDWEKDRSWSKVLYFSDYQIALTIHRESTVGRDGAMNKLLLFYLGGMQYRSDVTHSSDIGQFFVPYSPHFSGSSRLTSKHVIGNGPVLFFCLHSSKKVPLSRDILDSQVETRTLLEKCKQAQTDCLYIDIVARTKNIGDTSIEDGIQFLGVDKNKVPTHY